jgi:hypothetical protein
MTARSGFRFEDPVGAAMSGDSCPAAIDDLRGNKTATTQREQAIAATPALDLSHPISKSNMQLLSIDSSKPEGAH